MSQPPAPAIYLVAAVAANGIIGANGRLPWHLPGELQHFKKLTMGHPIIMGRRTWESLRGPLPGRENVVVTTTAGYRAEGAAVARSLDAAVALCLGEPVAFVIGGTRLFAEALPIARGMVLTEIHRDYEGDSAFPTFERSQWRETQRKPNAAPDGTRFDYVLYERA